MELAKLCWKTLRWLLHIIFPAGERFIENISNPDTGEEYYALIMLSLVASVVAVLSLVPMLTLVYPTLTELGSTAKIAITCSPGVLFWLVG